MFAGGLHRGYGQRFFPRHDAPAGGGQDRYGADHRCPQPRGTLLPGFDGGLLPGRRAPLHGAHDHRNPRPGRESLLRGTAGGSRREAHGRLHLQPRPRLVRPCRRRRSAPLSRPDEGRRHRAGPPRGRPPVAPRLVRKPHGLGARRGGQPLERRHHEPARRPGRDARRAHRTAVCQPFHDGSLRQGVSGGFRERLFQAPPRRSGRRPVHAAGRRVRPVRRVHAGQGRRGRVADAADGRRVAPPSRTRKVSGPYLWRARSDRAQTQGRQERRFAGIQGGYPQVARERNRHALPLLCRRGTPLGSARPGGAGRRRKKDSHIPSSHSATAC